ncbi:DUF6455 family protein [Methylobacterium sp. P31]
MTKPSGESQLFDPFGIVPLLTAWGPLLGAAHELKDIDADYVQTMLENDISGTPERFRNLARLMRILHIDPEAIRLNEPALMNELEANCSRCKQRDRCLRELASGTIGDTYPEFCLSAPRLGRLLPA